MFFPHFSRVRAFENRRHTPTYDKLKVSPIDSVMVDVPCPSMGPGKTIKFIRPPVNVGARVEFDRRNKIPTKPGEAGKFYATGIPVKDVRHDRSTDTVST